jgi:glycosyltransferase involved in cell wall biosynthesis
MPVHNGAAFLRPAIDSILRQSFTDFEFIIVDDCSSDESVAMVQSFRDSRIRLLRAPDRLRICGALNLGLDHATGRFVARMDADDISRPCRLEKQVARLTRHSDVALCGAWVRRFWGDERGHIDKRPISDDDVRAYALFDNPLVHSTVMIRREVLDTFTIRYDEAYRNAEDYDLWIRMFPHGRAVNLPEVLLDYRVHPTSVTTLAGDGMDAAAIRVVERLLVEIGLDPTDEQVRFHRWLGTGRLYPERNREAIRRAESWLKELLKSNDRHRVYAPGPIRRAVAQVWYRTCYHSLSEGAWIVNRYLAFWRSACHGACPLRAATFLGAAVKDRFGADARPALTGRGDSCVRD